MEDFKSYEKSLRNGKVIQLMKKHKNEIIRQFYTHSDTNYLVPNTTGYMAKENFLYTRA